MTTLTVAIAATDSGRRLTSSASRRPPSWRAQCANTRWLWRSCRAPNASDRFGRRGHEDGSGCPGRTGVRAGSHDGGVNQDPRGPSRFNEADTIGLAKILAIARTNHCPPCRTTPSSRSASWQPENHYPGSAPEAERTETVDRSGCSNRTRLLQDEVASHLIGGCVTGARRRLRTGQRLSDPGCSPMQPHATSPPQWPPRTRSLHRSVA